MPSIIHANFYRVEPSLVPEYSTGFWASPSYYSIEASFDKMSTNARLANLGFGAYKHSIFVSLFSNLVEILLISTPTSTVRTTNYTSTETSTSHSTTVTLPTVLVEHVYLPT